MVKIKDPLVSNIESAREILEKEVEELDQEVRDLSDFREDLSITRLEPDISFVDSFKDNFYNRHGDKYSEDTAKEALIEEIEGDFDFLDEQSRQEVHDTAEVGNRITNMAIEPRKVTGKNLQEELTFLSRIQYEIDQDYRAEVGNKPRTAFLKDGKLEMIKRDVFEEEMYKNPGETPNITSHLGDIKASKDYLELLAGFASRKINSKDWKHREYTYRNKDFQNPVLDGIGTCLKALREERKKTERYLIEGTEHDYILDVWTDHLEESLEDEENWDVAGTEIDYRAKTNGDSIQGEFDILLENLEYGDHIYLEVKPIKEHRKDAENQIDRITDAEEVVALDEAGYRHLRSKENGVESGEIRGYIVQNLPDYTQDPLDILEENSNKAIIG